MQRSDARKRGAGRRAGFRLFFSIFRDSSFGAHDSRSRNRHLVGIPDVPKHMAICLGRWQPPRFPQAIFLLDFSYGSSSHSNASKTTGSRRGSMHGAGRPIRIGDRRGSAKEKRNSICASHGWLWASVGSMVPSRFQPNARMGCSSRWLVRQRHCPYRPFGNARNRHAVQWLGRLGAISLFAAVEAIGFDLAMRHPTLPNGAQANNAISTISLSAHNDTIQSNNANPPQWGKFRKLGCAQQACSGTVAAESGRKGILGFPTKKRVGFATLHWFANWISFPIPTGFPT